MVCCVYGLSSTRDGELRYIGQTTRALEHRLSRHFDRSKRSRSHLACWLRKEKGDGYEIVATVLVADAVWNETETELIAQYAASGHRLVNATVGGEGCLGYRHDEKTRQKMRDTHLGKPLEMTERRRSAIARNLTALHSPEARAKIAASLTGRTLSAETIAKRTSTRMADGSYAYTDERRARQSEIIKAWWRARKEAAHVA